jgi:N-acetylneuraminic acid mutarotase
MNKYFPFLLALMVLTSACKKKTNDVVLPGNWTQTDAGYPGVARNSAVIFSPDNTTMYTGLGFNNEGNRIKDFWSYNAQAGIWKQVDSVFPGSARYGAVAFGLNGKGYVGLGYDTGYLSDMYEYDPAQRKWRRIKDFPGGRRYAVAFTIGDKAYVGTGYDGNYRQDFWQYDAVNDNWIQVADFTGTKREGATAFVVNGKGYVGFGVNNGTPLKNIYEFDPTTLSWTKKTAIGDIDDVKARSNAPAFVIGNKAYICMGLSGSAFQDDMWEYDPAADTWTRLSAISKNCGFNRAYTLAFSYNNVGYLTTGLSGSGRLDDFWSFSPTPANTGCAK